MELGTVWQSAVLRSLSSKEEDISDCGFQKKNKQKKYKENKLGVEEILSHQEDTENSWIS